MPQVEAPIVEQAKELINRAFGTLKQGVSITVNAIDVVISFGLTFVGLFRDKLDEWTRANILDPAVEYLRKAKDTIDRALPLIESEVKNIQEVLGWWSTVTQSQINNIVWVINNWIIQRISILEKWREDAAAWLHNYLQPIAEGARDLSNTLKDWVNNVAVPWFNKIETSITQVKASLQTMWKNLTDSINTLSVKIDSSVTALRSELSTAVTNIQNVISQSVAKLTGQINDVDKKQTAAWQALQTALQQAQATLTQAITQTQTELRNNVNEVTSVITDEIDKERKEGPDWILELFCLATHSVTIERQGKLADVLMKAFTGLKR